MEIRQLTIVDSLIVGRGTKHEHLLIGGGALITSLVSLMLNRHQVELLPLCLLLACLYDVLGRINVGLP